MTSLEEDVDNKTALLSLAICKALLNTINLDSNSNFELLDSKFQTIKNAPLILNQNYEIMLKYHIDKCWMTQNVFTALVDLIDAQYMLARQQHVENK